MSDYNKFMYHVLMGNLNGVKNCYNADFLERTKADSSEYRPIHWACIWGHVEIVKFLVANKCSIECEDKNKYRPIHLACYWGKLDVVQFLCECQCELECRTKDGETPIEVARKNRKKDCEDYLDKIPKSHFINEIMLVFKKQLAESKREHEKNIENIRNLCEGLNEQQTILRETATGLDKVVQENTAITNEMLVFKEELAEQKREFEKITEHIRNLREELKEHETILKEMRTGLVQEVTDMQLMEEKLSQIQISQNYGELLWCIKKWNDLLKQDQDQTEQPIYSDPFYSYKNGYKMCLELNFVRDHHRSEPHFSLYVCIMQGEYDSILQWPFPHGVKLELLDQESGKVHVSKIVEYKQQETHVGWRKPTEQRNTATGFDNFIALSELFCNDSLCRDDQIWIKATFVKS